MSILHSRFVSCVPASLFLTAGHNLKFCIKSSRLANHLLKASHSKKLKNDSAFGNVKHHALGIFVGWTAVSMFWIVIAISSRRRLYFPFSFNISLVVSRGTFLVPWKWPISMLFENSFLQNVRTYGRLLALRKTCIGHLDRMCKICD